MSDSLAYLDGVAARVSNTLLPSELRDVAQFLQGKQWLVASGPVALGDDSAAAATVRMPNGLLHWHPFIPLAVGVSSAVAALSTDHRVALSNYFLREGFARVLAVSLSPNASVPLASFSAEGNGDGDGDGDGGGPRLASGEPTVEPPHHRGGSGRGGANVSHARSVRSARMECADAVRRFVASVEAAAKAETAAADTVAAEPVRHKRGRDWEARGQDGEDGCAEARPAVEVVRRLLVVVRCCADNRIASSSAAAVASHDGGRRGGRSRGGAAAAGAAGAAGGVSSATARRHRHGSDPLLPLLHDIAAVLSLSDARLRRTRWRVRVGVLVLPDDQAYGGALLAQRLGEEVGHRYCVHLFGKEAEDGDDAAGEEGAEGRSAAPPPSSSRAVRLLKVWEPAVLYAVPSDRGAGAPPGDDDADNGGDNGGVEAVVSRSRLAATLTRHERFFWLREANLPLCCFIRDALQLFPILVPPAVLRHWQVLWAARHSLRDVVLGFHATLAPFTHSEVFADAMDAASSSSSSGGGSGGASRPPSSAERRGPEAVSVDAALEKTGRQRRRAVDILEDTTDLLDALFFAAASLSGGDELDEAVLFMLLYEELAQQRGALRLSRIAPTATALEDIYRREWRALRGERIANAVVGERSTDGGVGGEEATALSASQCIRRAIARHLPFYWPSRVVLSERWDAVPPTTEETPLSAAARHRALTTLPAVMQFVNLGMSAGPSLQRTLLSALQPPDISLLELQAATSDFQFRAASALCGRPLANASAPPAAPLLSSNNFYGPLIPDSVRVLYLLTAHAVGCRTDRETHVPVVQLQQVCQVSDERLLLVLRELQLAGLATVNLQDQTARTTLTP